MLFIEIQKINVRNTIFLSVNDNVKCRNHKLETFDKTQLWKERYIEDFFYF